MFDLDTSFACSLQLDVRFLMTARQFQTFEDQSETQMAFQVIRPFIHGRGQPLVDVF